MESVGQSVRVKKYYASELSKYIKSFTLAFVFVEIFSFQVTTRGWAWGPQADAGLGDGGCGAGGRRFFSRATGYTGAKKMMLFQQLFQARFALTISRSILRVGRTDDAWLQLTNTFFRFCQLVDGLH